MAAGEPRVNLLTGRFQNRRLKGGGYLAVPICLSLPRWKLAYSLAPSLRALAPKYAYLRAPFEEYRRHYRHDLHVLGVKRIRAMLEETASPDGFQTVLLCYEDLRKPEAWCHRRLFAEWWQEQTGEDVPELDEEEQIAMF